MCTPKVNQSYKNKYTGEVGVVSNIYSIWSRRDEEDITYVEFNGKAIRLSTFKHDYKEYPEA